MRENVPPPTFTNLLTNKIMKNIEKIMSAAIVLAMQFPVNANCVQEVCKEFDVDSKDVMSEVKAILNSEVVAEMDMEGEL